MDRLGHDIDAVLEILQGCDQSELRWRGRSDWSEMHFVYQFIVELEDEPPLYVKVSIHGVSLEDALLLSYKLDGSPE